MLIVTTIYNQLFINRVPSDRERLIVFKQWGVGGGAVGYSRDMIAVRQEGGGEQQQQRRAARADAAHGASGGRMGAGWRASSLAAHVTRRTGCDAAPTTPTSLGSRCRVLIDRFGRDPGRHRLSLLLSTVATAAASSTPNYYTSQLLTSTTFFEPAHHRTAALPPPLLFAFPLRVDANINNEQTYLYRICLSAIYDIIMFLTLCVKDN